MTRSTFLSRTLLLGLLAATCVATLQYSAPAEAHWRRGGGGGGWFVGGLVIGAALAPRYVYPAPAPVYYYPPPTYYAPPPVVYTQPPVVVQPASPVVVAPPPVPAPQAQPSSIEDRLRRLRNLCEQGLLTAHECQTRREEVLREL